MVDINTRFITTAPMGQAIDISAKELIDAAAAAIIAESGGATAAQGAKADSALQPVVSGSKIAGGGWAKHAVISGGAAGTHTTTGIKAGDELLEVIYYAFTDGALTGVSDLTSEFTISATNTIANANGTDTTGGTLIARWNKLTA